MKKINVKIVGCSDLLMNNPKSMLDMPEEGAVVKTTKNRDHKKDAENAAYKTNKGFLYCPNTAIKGTIINASSYKKIGKNTLRPLIAGGIRIPTEELLIKQKGKPIKNYDIDLRTVVIQRARVPKARPKIANWEIDFEILYNEILIPDPNVIRVVLEEAGQRIGILDFRPQKNGEFGTFKVTKFIPTK